MFYTGKGDDGTSGLFGTKERFSKTDSIYEALGTVDELNSLVGVCKAKLNSETFDLPLTDMLAVAQQSLFIVQAELAGAGKKITKEQQTTLEDDIALISNLIKDPQSFVVPGANELSAYCDLARSVARRAERAVLMARAEHPVCDQTVSYLNRLSSLFYVMARYTAQIRGCKEESPNY